MEIYSHTEIESVIAVEGNQKCMDCGNAKTKWASINNGVILCLKCAGIHRNFGLSVSIVRSLQIDSWEDKQIVFLKKGGNANYAKMLESFNIPLTASLDIKYKSKAAEYYRKVLRQEVEKEVNKDYVPVDIEKPDIEISSEVIEVNTIQKEISNDDLIGSQGKMIEPKEESFFGYVGGFFSMAKDQVMTHSKIITDQVSGLGEKLVQGGQYVVGKGQEAIKSEFVQNIAQTTEKGINALVDKTKQMLGQDNTQSQEQANPEAPPRDESEPEITDIPRDPPNQYQP